jgi:hypothetical protein
MTLNPRHKQVSNPWHSVDARQQHTVQRPRRSENPLQSGTRPTAVELNGPAGQSLAAHMGFKSETSCASRSLRDLMASLTGHSIQIAGPRTEDPSWPPRIAGAQVLDICAVRQHAKPAREPRRTHICRLGSPLTPIVSCAERRASLSTSQPAPEKLCLVSTA